MTKQMFVDVEEEQTTIRTRQQELKRNLTTAVQDFLPPPHVLPNIELAERLAVDAISLKQSLMLSPMDCRIHYCHPGVIFDPSWMQANNSENLEVGGDLVAGKPVTLCLFPALFAQEARPFDSQSRMEDAFVKNKRFFYTTKEPIDCNSGRCITKAIVLVL